MYLEQGPAALSRSIFAEPVNAPKKSVFVSTASGAVRTIVGVPMLPRSANTPSGPRVSAVCANAAWPATGGFAVVGHFGATPAGAVCTSRS